jgi:hypothetical protein
MVNSDQVPTVTGNPNKSFLQTNTSSWDIHILVDDKKKGGASIPNPV